MQIASKDLKILTLMESVSGELELDYARKRRTTL